MVKKSFWKFLQCCHVSLNKTHEMNLNPVFGLMPFLVSIANQSLLPPCLYFHTSKSSISLGILSHLTNWHGTQVSVSYQHSYKLPYNCANSIVNISLLQSTAIRNTIWNKIQILCSLQTSFISITSNLEVFYGCWEKVTRKCFHILTLCSFFNSIFAKDNIAHTIMC